MHKPESVIRNEIYKIFCDIDVQMCHSIQSRKPDLVMIKKKKITCHLVYFAIAVDNIVKVKDCKKAGQIPGSCQRAKKLYNKKVTLI